MRGTDLRHDARHGAYAYTAAEAEARLERLRYHGFDEAAAEKVFEAIDLPDVAKIDQKISYAHRLGMDGVAIAEKFAAILGYNIDRLRLAVRIIRAVHADDPARALSYIITKDPAVVVAALILLRPGNMADLRAGTRLRAGLPSDNHDIIARRPKDKAVLSYRRYRPVPPKQIERGTAA